MTVNSFEHFDSDFEIEVYDFLRAKGFSVDTQVGCSGFKIDLGLKNPNSSDYVLAIECDGATYHSSRNARDRDRLRQEIIEHHPRNIKYRNEKNRRHQETEEV